MTELSFILQSVVHVEDDETLSAEGRLLVLTRRAILLYLAESESPWALVLDLFHALTTHWNRELQALTLLALYEARAKVDARD